MSKKGDMPRRGRSLHVLRVLRERIAEGEYPLNTKLPGERALAEEFGVSRVTIRKSLESLKSDGMIENRPGLGHIIIALEPVVIATQPDIGFVVQQLSNPYYSAFASELEAVLRRHDLNLILAGTGQDPEEELRCLERLNERKVKGVLLCVPDLLQHPEAVKVYLRKGLPIVIIGPRQPGLGVDTIDTDNRSAMTLAIDHLIELGHERIGFLSALAFGRNDHRRELTAEILRARGLDPGHVITVDSPDLAGGRMALDIMMEQKNRPTALVCTNDITAIGAVQRAFELGISVPEEFSLVGFDDIPMAGMAAVPLTTLAVPLDVFAEEAYKRLAARADGYSGNPIHVAVEPKLVTRASTAPPVKG